jgi:hypothetical protein
MTPMIVSGTIQKSVTIWSEMTPMNERSQNEMNLSVKRSAKKTSQSASARILNESPQRRGVWGAAL